MGTVTSLPSLSRFFRMDILRPVFRAGVLLVLCGLIWGCGLVNPAPPRAVVAEAVAQKVAQTQVLLQQQWGVVVAPGSVDLPQASGIHVTGHRWMTLNNQPAVVVNGLSPQGWWARLGPTAPNPPLQPLSAPNGGGSMGGGGSSSS